MMKTGIWVVAGIFLSLLLAAESFAQPPMWPGGGGWGMGTPYGRMYNPNTVETIQGEILKVERITPMTGMSSGIHLLVKTEKGETLSVHLGPAWYIENQDVEIKTGSKVEITGSRVMFRNEPILFAKELRMGDQVLTLRDDQGLPLWSGWRRRR